MRLFDFVDELSSDSPAPGGGSVAALCGALSAALSSMVAALTWSKKGLEDRRPKMQEVGGKAQVLKDLFVDAVDADTEAFNAVLAARRLPKKTDEEKAARLEAMEQANQESTRVPLDVLEHSVAALELALEVVKEGNPSSVTDAGVGGACALAAAQGAALNVRINLPSITNVQAAERFASSLETSLRKAHEIAEQVRSTVEGALPDSKSEPRQTSPLHSTLGLVNTAAFPYKRP